MTTATNNTPSGKGAYPSSAARYGAPPGIAEYLPQQLQDLLFDPFTYSITQLNLLASGTASPQTKIQNTSHFVCTKLSGSVRNTGAITIATSVPITVQLQDTGSGAFFSNEAEDWLGYVGTAQLPFLFEVPKLIEANATIVAALQNLDGAQAYDVRLLLSGFRIFDLPRDDPQVPIPGN